MPDLRLRDAASVVCSRDSWILRFGFRVLWLLLGTERLRRLRRELIGRDPIRAALPEWPVKPHVCCALRCLSD